MGNWVGAYEAKLQERFAYERLLSSEQTALRRSFIEAGLWAEFMQADRPLSLREKITALLRR